MRLSLKALTIASGLLWGGGVLCVGLWFISQALHTVQASSMWSVPSTQASMEPAA